MLHVQNDTFFSCKNRVEGCLELYTSTPMNKGGGGDGSGSHDACFIPKRHFLLMQEPGERLFRIVYGTGRKVAADTDDSI